MASNPQTRRLIVSCAAVNQIDSTALGMLTDLEGSLAGQGVRLELAEVKGPVMDRLARTPLAERLKGRIHLSLHEALMVDQ